MPAMKKTKAIYVRQGNIAIAPRDSVLRMWKICSTSTACLDKEHKRYRHYEKTPSTEGVGHCQSPTTSAMVWQHI